MQLLRAVRSQIQYKIILPYLLLMILVTLAGAGIALILVASSWQERFDNQLGQTARNFTGAMAQHEVDNLNFLTQIVFSEANPAVQAPSVREAVQNRDVPGLEKALEPLYRLGLSNERITFDRLIAFNMQAEALVDWERTSVNPTVPRKWVGTDLSGLEQVQRVLRGETDSVNGVEVDKFSALVKFRLDDGQDQLYFATIVPVRNNGDVVGGMLLGSRLDSLLQQLQTESQSAITTLYDINGRALGTTVGGQELATLDMPQALVLEAVNLNERVRAALAASPQSGAPVVPGENPLDPCLDIGNQPGGLTNPLTLSRLPSCSVKERKLLADREYEFVYAPLLIRGAQTGYFSISLSRDFIVSAWSSSRWVIIGVTALLAIGSVLVGYWVARQITTRLGNLVETAEAVTSGDLARRSAVGSPDELGRLALAFNQMTEHLLRLYTTSRDLNQAIEVRDVLEVATRSATSAVPGTEVVALLNEGETWHYYVRQDGPQHLQRLPTLAIAPQEPLLKQLASAPQPVQWHVHEGANLLPAPLHNEAGFQTALISPVQMQNRLVGALIFGHQQAQAFNESDVQVLVALANMSGTVLHNALLYDRVQAEAQERQAILTSIGDGVVVCDQRGRVVLLNRAAEQMLGLHDWREQRYHFDELPLIPLDTSRDLFTQSQAVRQYRIGSRIVSRTDSPVIDDENQMIGEVVVLHDITETVAVDGAKNDFIATISHELRTPLTVIRSSIDLMLRGFGGKVSADHAELLELARTRANDMTGLINNAITIADLSVGKLSTDLQPQDVWVSVERALSPLRAAFESKGLEVCLDGVDADIPPVLADREQLNIALTQLLDNAYRYTQQGNITVRAHMVGKNVQIDICDTGQGIAPDVLNRLFTPFQRVRGNESPQRGGGLGLAIARQLIERQGGQVRVSSTPDRGSTFSIMLPYVNEQSLAVATTNEQASSP